MESKCVDDMHQVLVTMLQRNRHVIARFATISKILYQHPDPVTNTTAVSPIICHQHELVINHDYYFPGRSTRTGVLFIFAIFIKISIFRTEIQSVLEYTDMHIRPIFR